MSAAPNKPPTIRVNMTVRETDWVLAEKLRVAMGERSCSAVVRRLIREAAKEKLP